MLRTEDHSVLKEHEINDVPQPPWVSVHFDARAVESSQHIMFITTFLKKVLVYNSSDVEVFVRLPVGEECTFLFSPGATLVGVDVLKKFNGIPCHTPEPETRLHKLN